MPYLLIHFLAMLFIPLVAYTQQDIVQWQTYDSKTMGVRWKLPNGWKIVETQSNALVRIDFIGPDISVNSWLMEYKELQGEMSDVLEKVAQENSFSEENRLTGETNGIEQVTVSGQVTVDEESMDAEITIFYIGDEHYLIFCFFTNENTNQARNKTIGREIAKSFEGIMNADDLDIEVPAKEEEEDQ